MISSASFIDSLSYIITIHDPVIERAVDDIEDFYKRLYNKAKKGRLSTEESITSPIIMEIDGKVVGEKTIFSREYNKYTEEKPIGADIGITIVYHDEHGNPIFQKGLLIQSKIIYRRPHPRLRGIFSAQAQCLVMLKHCSASFIKLYDPFDDSTYYIPAANFAFAKLNDDMSLSSLLAKVYYMTNSSFYKLMLKCFIGEYGNSVDDPTTMIKLYVPYDAWSK